MSDTGDDSAVTDILKTDRSAFVEAFKDPEAAKVFLRGLQDSGFTRGKRIYMSPQNPAMQSTNALELQLMLHMIPNATTTRWTPVVEGDPGPNFELTGLDGNVVTMDDYRGRPLVLRFTRAASTGFI